MAMVKRCHLCDVVLSARPWSVTDCKRADGTFRSTEFCTRRCADLFGVAVATKERERRVSEAERRADELMTSLGYELDEATQTYVALDGRDYG